MERKIRIGIDGRPLQGKRTGVGRYVFELCRVLDELLPEAVFFVYSQIPVEMPVESPRWIMRHEPLSLARHLKSVLWIKFRAGTLCKRDNLDIYWGGASFLPILPRAVHSIVTVHDMNHEICPSAMSRTHLWAYRLFFRRDVLRAGAVVTNSYGTAQRLFESTGRHTDAVVTPAVDTHFQPATDKAINNCLERHQITTPYLLAVATWEPRKNLELLIRTFINMKRDGLLPDQKLVLVGGKGWKDQRLIELINREKGEHILPLGYLEDTDLISLYSGCALFVFPSLYEGYGIPVIEALACGSRVVASDMPETREAGGDAAVYVYPDELGLKEGIMKALALPKQVSSINLPTWEHGAATLAEIFTK